MSIDLFGRRLGRRRLPTNTYKVTENGDYDIDNKRLCNVATPKHETDAANLKTVEEQVEVGITLKTLGIFADMNKLGEEMKGLKKDIEVKLDRITRLEIASLRGDVSRIKNEMKVFKKNPPPPKKTP